MELDPANEPAWRVWSICHQTRPLVATGLGAPILGRIDLRAVIDLCREYGGSRQDLEKVLLIEEIVWPRLNKRE